MSNKFNIIKKTSSGTVLNIFIYIFFVIYCFSILWIIWQLIITSVSPEIQNSTVQIRFWPNTIELGAYKEIWSHAGLAKAFMNNVYITVLGTLTHVIICALAGYALSKPAFPLKNVILNLIIYTMIIPSQLVMIPSFILYRDFGLINNLNSLVISGMISGFSIILMRNYFLNVPASLSESAKIDGANEVLIFFKIYIPISIPGLATIIMLQLIAKWNIFYEAVLYINSTDMQPLQAKLFNILNSITSMAQTGQNFKVVYGQNVTSAAVIISILPLLILYPFMQRYLIKGMLVGSVKE